MEECGRDWCVCGYHVYCEIWHACLPILAQTARLYCPYGPCFPLNAVWMAFTSWFAVAIACDCIENDNNALGSGRQFLDCSHLNLRNFIH